MANPIPISEAAKKAVENYGRAAVVQMLQILQQSGKYASGNLARSLRYDVTETVEGLEVLFSGAEHAQYVDAGRRPGTYPPKGVLLDWMRLKGIPAKAEFPIRRSIFLFGIAPTPFIDQSIDDNAYLLGAALDEAVLISVDEAMRVSK